MHEGQGETKNATAAPCQKRKKRRRKAVEPLLLTIDGARARYGRSRTRIYELLAEGRFRAVKQGNSTLVVTESADSYFLNLPEAELNMKGPARGRGDTKAAPAAAG